MLQPSMTKLIPYILHFAFFGFAVSTNAQPYRTAFNQGDSLYHLKEYYEAYLRFNAAEVLSRNAGNGQFALKSREWLDKAAFGIQRQQEVTDSLLQATKKLTDAFYFWDGRLALAYDGLNYGYINKEGTVVIAYEYEAAGNFDKSTGYAKVTKGLLQYWLAPDGKEFPADQPVSELPEVNRTQPVSKDIISSNQKVLSDATYQVRGKQDQHKVFKDGLEKFNAAQYYEAFQRFNAAAVLAKNAGDSQTEKWSLQLKDTAVFEIRQLFTRGKKALSIAQNIRDAVFFYDQQFALAYKDDYFYFIDQNGDEFQKLGRWEKAEQFGFKGFAKVKKGQLQYLMDTTGRTFRVAYSLDDLSHEVKALDLRGTFLNQFPAEVFNQPQLEVLILDGDYFRHNQFGKLSDSIQHLQNLKILSLDYCLVRELPQEIGLLKHLKVVELNSNLLNHIPPEIGQLSDLQILNLSSNQLNELPEEIGKLRHLKQLDLWSNYLSELPDQVSNLIQLTSLTLGYNHFKQFPDQLLFMKNLTMLDLNNNQLDSLPKSIGKLHQLASLDLSSNQFTNLPKEIIQLDQLKVLKLERNQLNTIPKAVFQLKKLKILKLANNGFSILPNDIIQLKNLETLDINSNKLNNLPSGITQLNRLKNLNLYNTQLSSLPKAINQLQNLTDLNLSGNQFQHFPTEILSLESLSILDLDANYLENIPAEIQQLKNLTYLNLRANQLLSICPEVGQLNQLTDLVLGNDYYTFQRNALEELPLEITQLKNLRDLDLSGNQLNKLPEGFSKIKNLTWLDLSWNQFEELPIELCELSNFTIEQ